jgi:hypothetical protein
MPNKPDWWIREELFKSTHIDCLKGPSPTPMIRTIHDIPENSYDLCCSPCPLKPRIRSIAINLQGEKLACGRYFVHG